MIDKLWFIGYNLIFIPLFYISFQILRLFSPKVAHGIKARKNLRSDVQNIADNGRKNILIHCSSAGEWEQARPFIAEMKKLNPQFFVIVMFFSASGYNFIRQTNEIDLKLYMPFDSWRGAKSFMLAINPMLWVIVKHDIWPNHVYAAGHLKIPSILIDASLPPSSKRAGRLIQNFNKSYYKFFDFIFPVAEEDKENFLKIYPYPERLIVSGDTRFDQVIRKAEAVSRDNKPQNLFEDKEKTVFIAGSVWSSDNKHLLPAVARLIVENESFNSIIVPHEPTEPHLNEIEEFLSDKNIDYRRFSTISDENPNSSRVVIVDNVGMLATLYLQTDIAYIGGSFGPGVHNVMEPFALCNPVLFGPRHTNSMEARQAVEKGCGFCVTCEEEAYSKLKILLEDDSLRVRLGEDAKSIVTSQCGATSEIMEHIKSKYDLAKI